MAGARQEGRAMAEQPTMAIPLDSFEVCVRGTELTKDQARISAVERTLTTAVGRRCGRTITECHGDDQPSQLRH
jgi:hypothetical protein